MDKLIVVVVDGEKENVVKEFPADSYFSARTHAMYLAVNEPPVIKPVLYQVRQAGDQKLLFQTTHADIVSNTEVLPEWKQPLDVN